MGKNILIVVLAAMAVFSIVFAKIKSNEAEKQKLEALEAHVLALENQEKALAEEQKATEMAAKRLILEQEVDELMRALEVCE